MITQATCLVFIFGFKLVFQEFLLFVLVMHLFSLGILDE